MSDVNDTAEILEAVLDLVDQIRIAEFRDELGHPLKNNIAYRELVGLLAARGLAKP